MDTKEAIKFLKLEKYACDYSHRSNKSKYDKVMDLLKRGEKYEVMFNTILNWTMHDGSFIPVKELINLEQKYFPKNN